MARKPRIPSEFTSFKDSVEKFGLHVMLQKSHDKKIWIATVLLGNKCIWHNDGNPKEIPLPKFWESTAWKTYEKTLAKS